MGASGDIVTPLAVKIMDISNEQISRHLYGYKTLKCLSPEEVCETVKKEQLQNGISTEDLPPLSPRKLRVPDEISLCISSIPGEKFGACAARRIPHGTWFGPFEGKLVRTTELKVGFNTEYMWEIYHDGEVSHFLDGNNENTWMAFVRCARHKKEQNLVVFQYHGCIYYRTTKDIGLRGELLVWYDNKYTQILGIPVAWNDSRNTNSKRKSSIGGEESPKRRKEKAYPGLLLQKIDTKLNSPNEKYTNEILPLCIKRISPVSTVPVNFKCDKCLFSFHTKEQLANHKCLSQSWVPTLRLPSLDRARDIFRPMHISMPSPSDLTFFYRNHSFSPSQNFSYHSPPMDPLKQLPSAAHKGTPIAIRNF